MRLILTLLALLTGFAAQLAPAQARGRVESTASEAGVVGAVQIPRSSAICAAAASPAPVARFHHRPALEATLRSDRDCAPPAMLRSDRARE